ncbi:bifunctional riboflavin kinase/FAD synthetase [Desulfovibrio sp. OttesenSCG-928-I05]|nr:bifunctional riboflavin kinase/FAD synthetase [Desulfovibrio sp. OttesenSCG-928-I05]
MLTAYDLFCLKSLVPQGTAHAVTIGNFDGVHTGHRRLIEMTRTRAMEHGVRSVAVTFDPHPQQLLDGDHAPEPLTTLPRKLELFAALGLDIALVLPFTRGLAALGPEEFVRSILLDGLGMKSLVVGYDFALGKDRTGDFAFLRSLGEKSGFSVERADPVQVNGQTVSSSRIREFIREGRVDEAAPMMGRPHSVEGTVIHGFGRGKGLGFPTINISRNSTLLPAPGVYATLVEFAPAEESTPLMAVANIGVNPTFGGDSLSLEAHILDFSRDVYGCSARISFIRRLRGEVRFPDVDALTRQIAADSAAARSILSTAGSSAPLPAHRDSPASKEPSCAL